MNDIVEQARNRAISYRECGPSAEHTAAMLDELAFHVERLRAELAAMREQRDEAHGLIRNWQTDFIRVINDSTLAYAPVATYDMNDADKRAFLAATRKQGGGA